MVTAEVTPDNVQAVLQEAQDDAMDAAVQPLTDSELDAWEADTLARSDEDSAFPRALVLSIIADERKRRARHVNLVHALAGHPLARSNVYPIERTTL